MSAQLRLFADIRDLIDDPSPRVRTFAAIAAGKLDDEKATASLLKMLENNADNDIYERHAASYALSLIDLKWNAGDVRFAYSRGEVGNFAGNAKESRCGDRHVSG